MKQLVLLLPAILAAPATAQVDAPVYYGPEYYEPYPTTAQPETVPEPVYVEPYQVDPWANCAPGEVVLVDAPGLPASGALDPDLSPAARDLGTLIPPGARKSFFQKVNAGVAYMPRFDDDSIGMTELSADVVTALPFPKFHQPLTITPGYTVRFLDGPDFIDVPARLHDAEIDFNHLRRVADRWVFNGAVTFGWYADDHSFSSDDAFRVSGRALGIFEASPHSKWLLGVVYLNRAGWSLVPAVGYLYWTEDLKIDVVIPQPKIAWRTWSGGRPGYNERWLYLKGDFGGGIWAVERATGAPDTLSYSDLRVIFGTERKHIGHISRRWEMGYVFARELEYDSTPGEFALDDTLFVRGVLTY